MITVNCPDTAIVAEAFLTPTVAISPVATTCAPDCFIRSEITETVETAGTLNEPAAVFAATEAKEAAALIWAEASFTVPSNPNKRAPKLPEP